LKSALKTESKSNKVEFDVGHLEKLVENASKITIFQGSEDEQDVSQSKFNSVMNQNETLQLDETLKDQSSYA